MLKKPFRGFPGQPAPLPNIRIVLELLPDGRIQFSSSRPVPMISLISIFSGLVKEGADTIIRQQAGIIQVPEDDGSLNNNDDPKPEPEKVS